MQEPIGAEQSALYIWRRWQIQQFSKALWDCQQWEKDQERHDLGRVALSFHNGEWVVLVSDDLISRVLPF